MTLTDEEAAKAEAEYAALPGTQPDFYDSREISGDILIDRERFERMTRGLEAIGAKWTRCSIDERFGYLWCEGWRERPYKEAPFNPPYTFGESEGKEP